MEQNTVHKAGKKMSEEEVNKLNILISKKPHSGYYKAELLWFAGFVSK